jgi:glycosyltransferase involved in cell wall biosynthesis
MRIAFVSTYPPIECGIGTYTYDLNQALKKEQNETFVVSQIGAQGNNVFPIYGRASNSIATEIFTTCDKITPDVVHIQHEYGLYGAHKGVQVVDLLLRFRLAGEPVVTTLHTVYKELDNAQETILHTIMDTSSAVIVHEDFQKDTLVRYFGQAEKIHVIPHGVRELPPVADAKKKLGLEGKKILLLCGYFRPTKGFHKIVEWFPQICERVEDIVLVIAGKSRGLEFREYQHEFFETINNSPALDKILVLRGQFPQHTFDTIISASDVVALPYDLGAQSGIMAQCFAFGKPVVTSDLPAFKRSLRQCEGGLACASKQDYIEAIARVLNDTQLYQKYQANIKNHVEQKVGWSKVAQEHVKVYQSVVRVPYGRAKYVFWEE